MLFAAPELAQAQARPQASDMTVQQFLTVGADQARQG
jgi:hypothetical protein